MNTERPCAPAQPDRPASPVFVVNKGVTAGDQVRVNIRTLANSAAIRREKRNGRDVIIVPSATLPDDVVMNDILYPAAEIAKSFKTLERTPAPLGHPSINGKFLSARDPEGINAHYIGAWNENVRQEKGRVLLDKIIDVEFANQSEGGKRVLAAIDAGDPIHTSTGLLAIMDAANGDVPYKFVAREIEFDHDAILLDEEGAATPEQGVGMMVNAAGNEIEVINCALPVDGLDQEIDWAGTRLIEAVRRKADASVWQEMKGRILEALGLSKSEREPSNNSKDIEMTDKASFDALSSEVKTLSEAVGKIGTDVGTAVAEAVSNALKPLSDSVAALQNAQKAEEDRELTDLRAKIVKANLMDEATAGELTLNAARALASKAEPAKAAPIANSGFKLLGDDSAKPSFKLPAAVKEGA